jgi:prepilin-type processing-associated H-X9-DG protein
MDVVLGVREQWNGPSGPNHATARTDPDVLCPTVAHYGPVGPPAVPRPEDGVSTFATRSNFCDFYRFWSAHDGGAFFLFGDGSVRFLPYSADRVLPTLATRAGGEPDSFAD